MKESALIAGLDTPELQAKLQLTVAQGMVQRFAIRQLTATATAWISVALMFVLLREQLDQRLLLVWSCTLLIMQLITGLLAWQLHRNLDNERIRNRLLIVVPLVLFVEGALWGVTLVLPGADKMSMMYLIELLIVSAVGIITIFNLCTHPPAHICFDLGIIMPVFILGLADQASLQAQLLLPAGVLLGFCWFYGVSIRRLIASDLYSKALAEAMAEKLRRDALLDPLTECLNRRALLEHAQIEVTRSGRYNYTIGVILLDLDYFKSINDRFGHAVGDAVLVALAQRLRQRLRATDLLARWGGEEFLCLPTHIEPASLLGIAESLRQTIEAEPLLTHPSPMFVTASIGVSMHQPGTSIEATIQAADEALYRAKHAGRNQVCV